MYVSTTVYTCVLSTYIMCLLTEYWDRIATPLTSCIYYNIELPTISIVFFMML